MSIVEEAFSRLFPALAFNFETELAYSGRFKPYNATVRKIGNQINFNLSSRWKGTSDEIVIGLIQHLLIKILRKEKFFAAVVKSSHKMASLNMQLYDDFIKNISDVAVVPDNGGGSGSRDEKLGLSFKRVNEKYFFGLADRPYLKWGADSFRKLASYDYHINAITVSSLFSEAPEHLLDYLIYHELLHKKLKFSSSNGRSVHHSSEFRKLESKFEHSDQIEDELNAFIRGSRRKAYSPRRRANWLRLFSFQ